MSNDENSQHFVTFENLNPAVKEIKYELGEKSKVNIRKFEIEKELKSVRKKHSRLTFLKYRLFIIKNISRVF